MQRTRALSSTIAIKYGDAVFDGIYRSYRAFLFARKICFELNIFLLAVTESKGRSIYAAMLEYQNQALRRHCSNSERWQKYKETTKKCIELNSIRRLMSSAPIEKKCSKEHICAWKSAICSQERLKRTMKGI